MRRSLTLILLVALVLTGCTLAPKPKKAEPLQGTLRVLVLGGAGIEANLFTAFTKVNPDVKPESVALPDGDFPAIVEQMKSGALKVDAIVAPASPFLFAQGVVDPIDDMVKQENLSLKEYGSSIDLARYNGKLYGLPVSVSPMVVVYNKELFDQAGLKHPAPGWTWEEFETAAVALGKVQAGKEKGWGVTIPPWTMVDLLLTAGKGPTDADLTALEAAMGRLQRLHAAGDKVLPREAVGGNDLDYYQAFARREVGMMVNYWENSFGHTKPDFAWGVAPLPGTAPTPGIATLAMVSSKAENKATAQAFVRFAGGPTGAQIVTGLPGSPVPGHVTESLQQMWLAHSALKQGGAVLLNLTYLAQPEYPEAMAPLLLKEADAAITGKKTPAEAVAAYKQARAPLMSK